jgi:hypothetical protein
VEIESPHIRFQEPVQATKEVIDHQQHDDFQSGSSFNAVKALLRYACGSPTWNRLISFILRRIVVVVTDAKFSLDGKCTLLVYKSTFSHKKVYLRSAGQANENGVQTDDHKESVKMSKSFTRFKLRRSHSAILDISHMTLVTDGGSSNTDCGVVFAAQPLQFTATATFPRQHNERHRISLSFESSELQVNLHELSILLAGLRSSGAKSRPNIDNNKSFELTDYLEGIHVKLDKTTVVWSPKMKAVLKSLYVSGCSSCSGYGEEGSSRLALTTSQVSLLWCESKENSWNLMYIKSLQMDMERGVKVALEDSFSGSPNGHLTCVDVLLHFDEPTITVCYHVLKPLKAEILDVMLIWNMKQERKRTGDIEAKPTSGIFHTTVSATNSVFQIKDADGNVDKQIDTSLLRATIDRRTVGESEKLQSCSPNSSDTLVESYPDTPFSPSLHSRQVKTDLSFEMEDLTTWKQCNRYLHGRKFSPSACNYLSVDRFRMDYSATACDGGAFNSKTSTTLDNAARPSCSLVCGSVQIDIRDAPYFVERVMPWVSLVSELVNSDSQELVKLHSSASPSLSPLVRITIFSLEFSFLTIDRPLDKGTIIPTSHFSNAPQEEIGSGILFSAADILVTFPPEDMDNGIKASREGSKAISVSCKEVSLCSLVDNEGENFIFTLGHEPILWVPALTLNFHKEDSILRRRDSDDVLTVDLQLLQFCWSPQALYCILCLLKCINDTRTLLDQLKWKDSKVASDTKTKNRSLRVSISARQLIGRFSLAATMKVQMALSDGSVDILPKQTMVAAGELRFYGTAHHGKVWKRLLYASQLKLNQAGSNGSSIILHSLHFRLPYNYVCATIVEAAIHAWKLSKTLFNRLVKGNMIEWQGPSDRSGPFSVPSFQLRVQQFTFEFEDDPFESKLRLCWKTNLKEQSRRMKNEEAFKEKANSMCDEPGSSRSVVEDPMLSESLRITAMIADLKSKRHGSKQYGAQFASQSMEDKSKDAIEVAWQRLQEHNSKCWINEIRAATDQEMSSVQRHRQPWYEKTSKRSSTESYSQPPYRLAHSTYCHDAIDVSADPISPYAPLLGISVDNLTIDITSPSFSLDKTTSFVQDVGEGVPLDTEYSILLPFRMYCSGAKTSISLRDYPLPLLRVPEDKSARRDFRTAWTLAGDLVIADELGDVAGAWLKPMALLPERNYTLNLLRVASPLKFFSIVDIEVHTPEVTYIAWSMSIQPAIEDIIRIIDSFTPSPIDPSPKLGFWDKVRFMVHSRTRIRFLGQGDLALWMKGKKDPYSLSAEGSGIIKVWRRGVECRLGYSNSENELLQIFSDEYILAVPTLDFNDNGNSNTGSSSKGMFYIEEPQDHVYDQKYQKTVLSLTNGVRWGLACHFERLCGRGCTQCESTNLRGTCQLLRFEPHYSVVYRTPESVKQHHISDNVSWPTNCRYTVTRLPDI